MKKAKLALPFMALAIAVALSAFTAPPEPKQSSTTMLHWFTDPNVGSSFQGSNTKADEEAATLCDSNKELCEIGYTSQQLVDPDDPSQGVDPAQINNGVEIHKR